MNSAKITSARLLIPILAFTLLGCIVAVPAGAATKKCAKGKIAWKVEGRSLCVVGKVGGGTAEPIAVLSRTWLVDASRPLPLGGMRLPGPLRRAAPKVGRKVAAVISGKDAGKRSGRLALKGQVVERVDEVLGREELGDGVVLEGRLRGRAYKDESVAFDTDLEVRDTKGNAVRYSPNLTGLFVPEDPVGCPTADGVVRAKTRGEAGGTVIKLRRGRVLESKTEHHDWRIQAKGQVGQDARLQSVDADVRLTTRSYQRGLQVETTLKATVSMSRDGAPAVSGSPTIDVSIRAAGHSRAEEREAEANAAAAAAGSPEVAQSLGNLAKNARGNLLEAESGWYDVPNECARLDWQPGSGITLEKDETKRVTGVVTAVRDGGVANGSIAVSVSHGRLIPITSTFTPAAPASFIAAGGEPDSNGLTVHASAIGTSTAGRARATWTATGTPVRLPKAYHGTISATTTDDGLFRTFSGSADFTRTSVIRGPDGALYAWYELTSATLSEARERLGAAEDCAYEAVGSGGRIESGDVELHVRPDGEAVYALLYDLKVPATFEPTDCPPGAGDPFEDDIIAHLHSRRPEGVAERFRAVREGFMIEEAGVGDVTQFEGMTTSASWSLTPEF